MRDNFYTAVVAVLVLVGGAWAFDWSPMNLIAGPQYAAEPRTSGHDSRATFFSDILPKKYPALIEYLKQHGKLHVEWESQADEAREMSLTLSDKRILIVTTTIPSSAGEIEVRMADDNLDGQMDGIVYVEPSGALHTYEAPFDETSQYLWDSSLAITFRQSPCCP
jgi:hypothetical protein